MSFPRKRARQQAQDRAYEQAAGVKRKDTIADRHASGNVYSRADIEQLELHHTRFWRRKKRAR